MLFKRFLENKSDEAEQQSLNDKAYKDVNADWDPPSKKQQPLKEDISKYLINSIIDHFEELLKMEIKYNTDKKVSAEEVEKVAKKVREFADKSVNSMIK